VYFLKILYEYYWGFSKQDAVDKFWTSVDPYFIDITSNEMASLYENSMTVSRGWGSCNNSLCVYQHDEEQEYYKIPPLGKHYSYKWAMAEMQQGDRPQELPDKMLKDQTGDGMYHLMVSYD